MRHHLLTTVLVVLSVLTATASFAGSSQLKSYGDVAQFAIPVGAFAISFAENDLEGDRQLVRDMIATFTVTEEGAEDLYPVVGPEFIGFRMSALM